MMRLNLRDYGLGPVSASGTTTVKEHNLGLRKTAQNLAVVLISEKAAVGSIESIENELLQYILIDYYTKSEPWHSFHNRVSAVEIVTANLSSSYLTMHTHSSHVSKLGDQIIQNSYSRYIAPNRVKSFALPIRSPELISYRKSDVDFLWQAKRRAYAAHIDGSLLQVIESQGAGPPTPANLAHIISIIDNLLEDNKFEELSEALEMIDLEKSHPSHAVAVLRTTGIVRGKIANWTKFRDQVRDLLVEKGFNTEKVLRGLM